MLTLASLAWACTPSGFGIPLAVTPAEGPKGTAVSLDATGYAPSSSVAIELVSDADAAEHAPLGTVMTDATGRLAATVTIPDVTPGAYTVLAGQNGRGAFQVTPTPEPPPTPPVEPPAAEPASAWQQPAPVFDATAALSSSTAGALASGDTKAPRVRVRSTGNGRLAVVLRRGLAFTVGCSEHCRIQARAVTDATTARRLRLGGVVARGSASLARADRRVVVRLSSAARSKLRALRTVKFKVVFTVTDRAGNRAAVTRTVTVKR